MPMLAIAALAALTYAFRLAGPLLQERVTVTATAQRLFTSAAAVLLVALAATSALTAGHDFAGWARPAGVAAAGLLAARRAPFPVVVLVAASVTALLRLAGIHLSERARGDLRSRRQRVELPLSDPRGFPEHVHEPPDRGEALDGVEPFQGVGAAVGPVRVVPGFDVPGALLVQDGVVSVVVPLRPGRQRLVEGRASRPQ